MRKPRILLIDDDEEYVETLYYYFKKKGLTLYTAMNGKEGIECLPDVQPDCIILDILMPYQTGAQVYKAARKYSADLPVIICTGTSLLIKEAVKDPQVAYLQKPYEMMELTSLIKYFLSKSEPHQTT